MADIRQRKCSAEVIAYHSDRVVKIGQAQGKNEYIPNYQLDGPYIDDFHRYLDTCPMNGIIIDIVIPGWLRRADALKLYELGYFAGGDILEFGTNRGLSAYIMAKAITASGRNSKVVTMELAEEVSKIARTNLSRENVSQYVDFKVGDANKTCLDLVSSGRTFGLAFVDHSHAYEHVVSACHRVNELLEIGSFCVFHDYTDRRNSRRTGVGESSLEYGIIAGVEDALDPKAFTFVGAYGCCGVFRKVG